MNSGNKIILLVEDEIIIGIAEKKILEKQGYTVILVETGEEAIEVCNKTTIDLILMDIDLGNGIDGTEAAECILKEHDIPVVFLSSHSEVEVVQKTEKITSYGYIVKNSHTTVLEASIKMAFKLFESNKKTQNTANELSTLMKNLPGMVYYCLNDRDWTMQFISSKAHTLTGYLPEELIKNTTISFNTLIHPDDREFVYTTIEDCIASKSPYIIEYRIITKNSELKYVSEQGQALLSDDNSVYALQGFITDITERKQLELYHQINNDVLQILNDTDDFDYTIQKILESVKIMTGFDAVGIRLQNGEDYPYYTQKGFSTDFLYTENSLLERNTSGDVCRNSKGDICLGCTCGQVISGNIDKENPYFSKNGSYWTNEQAIVPVADTRFMPRDRCFHDGFKSIMLVPIRHKDTIVGLIQINDKRKGCFTLSTVELVEGIASYIGTALLRKQNENKIKTLLDEKELILREVHHRIKNNMNTIYGLLSLQAGTLSEPAAIAALDDAGNRVRSMMLLYDKLYRSTDFTQLSTQVYLCPLIDEILSNFPNAHAFTIEKNIDDFILPVSELQPLGIIINELITNIMKYAFKGRTDGRISVDASLKEGFVSVVIADNGNGIPLSVSFENSSGFGLLLVKGLTEQLNGTIRIERGVGTRIILDFKR